MNPLHEIPAKTRSTLYWLGYIIGITGQGITIIWGSIAAASPDVSMPLWLVIASATLGLLQTQLNLLAGSNIAPSPEAGNSNRRNDRGFASTNILMPVAVFVIAAVSYLLVWLTVVSQR